MKTIGSDAVDSMYSENGLLIRLGLTKREYFAAAALQGICANVENGGGDDKTIAVNAVDCADALIERLNKEIE